MTTLSATLDDVCTVGFWRGSPEPVVLVAHVDEMTTRADALLQLMGDLNGSSISEPIYQAGFTNRDVQHAIEEALDIHPAGNAHKLGTPHPAWADVVYLDEDDVEGCEPVCAFVILSIA